MWHDVGSGSSYPVRPLADPDVPLSVWVNGGYGTGPMALFVQLEPWLGRATLLAAVRDFLAPGAARSVADLQAALERASGKDLGAYFGAWIFGTGSVEWPVFSVQTRDTGSGMTEVTVTQQHARPVPYPVTVELELRSATQTARASVDFGLAPTSNVARASVAFRGPVTSLTIDPDDRVLDLSVSSARRRFDAVRFHP